MSISRCCLNLSDVEVAVCASTAGDCHALHSLLDCTIAGILSSTSLGRPTPSIMRVIADGVACHQRKCSLRKHRLTTAGVGDRSAALAWATAVGDRRAARDLPTSKRVQSAAEVPVSASAVLIRGACGPLSP